MINLKEVLEEMAMGQIEQAKRMRIERQGWTYDLFGVGGWTHHEVRDNDGARIVFDSTDEVLEYIGQ